MEKKLVLVLLMVTLLAGGAFAQSNYVSAGFGGTFTADFVNYTWTSLGEQVINMIPDMEKNILDQNIIGGGFFAYFDAAYVMLSLGMGFYDISYANKDMQKELEASKAKLSLTTLDIGLYGKLPISLGAATLFPMLGVDFKIAIAQDTTVNGKKYTYEEVTSRSVIEYMSSVWLKFGLGVDIPLGTKMYLRPMFLYGIGTVPKDLKEELDYFNKEVGVDVLDSIICHGLDVKLALGFKF